MTSAAREFARASGFSQVSSRPVRLGFALVWLAFSGYAFFGAPPNDPQTLELIIQLSTGQWQGLNPLVVALFNLMGLWPIAFASLLLWDGHLRRSAARDATAEQEHSPDSQNAAVRNSIPARPIPAWPFVAASFGLGAFAILPYLALRQPLMRHESCSETVADLLEEKPSGLLKALNSAWLWAGLALGASLLLGYGLIRGDWTDFAAQWQTSRFIHVMTLDFCLLTVLFPILLRADLRRSDRD